MAAVGDDQCLLQAGHSLRKLVERFGGELDDGIIASRDEECRLLNRLPLPGGRKLPITIDVAIPVEAAAIAAALIGFDEIGNVFFGQPRGQIRRYGRFVKKPFPGFIIKDIPLP
jgi:hypothetical protein